MQHRGQSGSAALPEASKRPEFDPPTTAPRNLEKKRDGFQTLPRRRLSPACIDGLVEAYRAGATINELAVEFGIHRTTVAAHLDRKGVPRRSEATVWDDFALREAAELYATGLSLADVAHQFGIDAQTVANRFRRAGVTMRRRRGWNSQTVAPHA